MYRYKPGRTARKMYRHKAKYGTAGMSKRQLRALAREMDLINPGRGHRGHKKKDRYRQRLLTRHHRNSYATWAARRRGNPIRDDFAENVVGAALGNPKSHRGHRNKKRLAKSQWGRMASKGKYVLRSRLGDEWGEHGDGRRGHGRRSVSPQVRRALRLAKSGASFKSILGDMQSRIGHRNPRGRRIKVKLIRPMEFNGLSRSKRRLKIRHARNPKRDGTATRGEKRSVKREAWLLTVVQRGKDAEAILHRVKSVPASAPAAVKEHVPSAAAKAESVPVAIVEQQIVPAVEHAEAAMVRSRVQDLNELIADVERDIEKADAAGEDAEAEDLMEQKIKLVRQRTTLKDKANSLSISLTNPRRRNPGRRGGRTIDKRISRVLVGLKAYGRALKAYRSALRSKKRR